MAKKINVKLIMELRDAGLSRNMIAATRHMSKNSVGDVIHIADQKGITFSDVRDLDEDAVYRMFYPDKFAVETLYAQPDYGYIHQELKRTGVTLKLLWQEYQDRCSADGGIPMGYTKFCLGYSSHTAANRLTNHLEHKPGIVTEVDWSGPTMHYVDTATGELVKVYLFIATLPYSQYSTHAQDMPDQFKFSPWDERRIRNWAESIGKYTGEVIGRIFGGVSIKEQGYNPSLAVLRLSNKYSEARLEAACEYAIVNGIKRPRYHHLNSILASNQDEIYLEQKNAGGKNSAPMGYLRGSSYYGGGNDGQ